MNNKPVAWMHKIATSWVTTIPDDAKNEWIPLYTHPVKELTDEEIMDECFRADLAVSKNTDVFLLEHDLEALVTFAREILRKASEK